MEFENLIQVGMSHEKNYIVEEENLAIQIGSGSARVLATPWMIAFMERTSHQMIAACLPEGWSSVGVMVNVRHLAPSPLGSAVRVRAEVLEVQKNKVLLRVQAWDRKKLANGAIQDELIGAGEHERAIIEVTRFLKRVTAKINE
jgi:predicted thioesterase